MAENIGKITQVMGPVVDVEFEQGKLPTILTALTISNPTINDEEGNLVVEVASIWAIMWFGPSPWMLPTVWFAACR
jgi:F0F1-type ATP synthase beta subunit